MMSQGQSKGTGPQTYRQFLEKIGFQYKHAEPQNWLGDKVPFPMNPTFKPPPPISDVQRNTMYRLFMENPKQNNVRHLSKKFNLSLKRVTAILRLKGLEMAWLKGKTLQTGFQVGMERLLKAQTHHAAKKLDARYSDPLEVDEVRSDVHQADMLEQHENRDAARHRYERLYWESTPEDGREPIVPGSLVHAARTAELKHISEQAKANAKFMTRVPDTEFMKRPTQKILTLTREAGATTQFVDVGATFMDLGERVRRLTISQRKSKMREKRAFEKKQRFTRP
ncbi:eukaryotic mitochondrial regulator protein-domain-containing protein [Crassisporium funariophilum]|nr:eukaryotic mitochondrial regulator protein-domain-containing protein [Crassisporium funariophilum]